MPGTAQTTMKCSACALRYPWSPQTAGKKVKCKCGTIFVAPRTLDHPTQTVPTAAAPARSVVARPPTPARPAAEASPGRHARPATVSAAAAVPPASSTASRSAADIDLEDELDDLYNIADDMDAPPPLAPVAAAPTAPPTITKPGVAKIAKPKAGGKAPAFAGYRTKQVDDSEQKMAEVKRLLIPALGVLLLVGVVMGARQFVGQSKVDYSTLPGQDGEFQRIADRDGAHEAKEWLNANDSRGIVGFFWTRNKTAMAIDGWYAKGAKKVYSFGTSPMTAALAIELPDDPAKRTYFIEYAENWRKEHERGSPPVTDVGQKFVMIRFM